MTFDDSNVIAEFFNPKEFFLFLLTCVVGVISYLGKRHVVKFDSLEDRITEAQNICTENFRDLDKRVAIVEDRLENLQWNGEERRKHRRT